jgi:hypothetical protein
MGRNALRLIEEHQRTLAERERTAQYASLLRRTAPTTLARREFFGL